MAYHVVCRLLTQRLCRSWETFLVRWIQTRVEAFFLLADLAVTSDEFPLPFCKPISLECKGPYCICKHHRVNPACLQHHFWALHNQFKFNYAHAQKCVLSLLSEGLCMRLDSRHFRRSPKEYSPQDWVGCGSRCGKAVWPGYILFGMWQPFSLIGIWNSLCSERIRSYYWFAKHWSCHPYYHR